MTQYCILVAVATLIILAVIILIQDHLYHELECRETVHSSEVNTLHVTSLELPSTVMGDFVQHQEHPPVYQEITDLHVTKQGSEGVIH